MYSRELIEDVEARRDLLPAPGLEERDRGFGEAERTERLSVGCKEGDRPAADGDRDWDPGWVLFPVISDNARPRPGFESVEITNGVTEDLPVLGDRLPSPKGLFPGSKLFCLDTGAGSI
jgi:hypothetical protein